MLQFFVLLKRLLINGQIWKDRFWRWTGDIKKCETFFFLRGGGEREHLNLSEDRHDITSCFYHIVQLYYLYLLKRFDYIPNETNCNIIFGHFTLIFCFTKRPFIHTHTYFFNVIVTNSNGVIFVVVVFSIWFFIFYFLLHVHTLTFT